VFPIKPESDVAILYIPPTILMLRVVTALGVSIPKFSVAHVPVLHYVKYELNVSERSSVNTSFM
jgi:hypothetical protein